MREKLSTPFLVWRGGLNLRRPPFHRLLGTLSFRFNCDQILPSREESRIPSTIAGYQVVGDTHHHFFVLTGLNLENKIGVETGAVKKVLVSERDMVNGVVLPNCLRAVGTVDWDVCAWRVFRRLLGCAVLERAAKPAIRFNLSFASGSDEASVALVATAESARVMPNLARVSTGYETWRKGAHLFHEVFLNAK